MCGSFFFCSSFSSFHYVGWGCRLICLSFLCVYIWVQKNVRHTEEEKGERRGERCSGERWRRADLGKSKKKKTCKKPKLV